MRKRGELGSREFHAKGIVGVYEEEFVVGVFFGGGLLMDVIEEMLLGAAVA